MRRGLPMGPLVATVIAASAANVLVAYVLARVLFRGQSLYLDPLALASVGVVAAVSSVAAFTGWRDYLRRRIA